jgi:hypothetical protein
MNQDIAHFWLKSKPYGAIKLQSSTASAAKAGNRLTGTRKPAEILGKTP